MSRLRFVLVCLALIGGAAASAFLLYGKKGEGGNQQADPCQAAASQAAALRPLAVGEIAALKPLQTPVSFPAIEIETAQGRVPFESLRGRVILLNLWATWCVPCREEMPALDQLQQRKGGADFEVVALNMDTRMVERVPKWLAENQIKALTFYADPAGKAFQALRSVGKVQGLPTTFLINRQGCLLADMAGPAQWSSDQAIALIEQAIKVTKP